MSSLQEKIENLKKDADEIQKLAENLINSAPVNMSRHLNMYLFDTLPNELCDIQTKLKFKYLAWYNAVHPLIKEYLPHQLVDFQSKYNKTGGLFSTAISDIIDLKTGFRPQEGRLKVIQDFRECFTFQIGLLLSIQVEEVVIPKKQKDEIDILSLIHI